ncbi:hypothetical protein [uncultured Methanobrevibacter sp.]|uniref:hypothetical protein n=1 Tax=uncultured Methanobrevibacter sp. TaxID=253161 RepID=UPI0025EF2F84|nr:hypothetical protein [uncultured Methanobrevibacter sp.]
MKESIQVYLFVFAIVAVMAFLLSGVFANIVVIDNSNSTKLTAIEDDSFEPHQIENVKVIVPKVQNKTQTNNNNTTILNNITNGIIEVVDEVIPKPTGGQVG